MGHQQERLVAVACAFQAGEHVLRRPGNDRMSEAVCDVSLLHLRPQAERGQLAHKVVAHRGVGARAGGVRAASDSADVL